MIQHNRRGDFVDSGAGGVFYPEGFIGAAANFVGSMIVNNFTPVQVPLTKLWDLDQVLHPMIEMYDGLNNRITVKYDGDYRIIASGTMLPLTLGGRGLILPRFNSESLDVRLVSGPYTMVKPTMRQPIWAPITRHTLSEGDYFELWAFYGADTTNDPTKELELTTAYLSVTMIKS